MQILNVFKSISDLTRLRIVRLLVMNRCEICVGEFVDSVQGRPYNISKQLKILEQAGLLQSRKQGRHVFFQLASNDAILTEALFELIETVPDAEDRFSGDQSRFENRDRNDEMMPVVENVPVMEESLPSNLL